MAESGEKNVTGRSLSEEERDDEVFDDDDPEMYAGGRRMNRGLIRRYHRQITESEGFEITLDLELGVPIGAPIIPQRGRENTDTYTELSHLAISTFNSNNGTNYEFVMNEMVNISYASGMWCYITFQAKDATSTTADDLKTFQTLAWWGINGSRDVRFCRLKKPPEPSS